MCELQRKAHIYSRNLKYEFKTTISTHSAILNKIKKILIN